MVFSIGVVPYNPDGWGPADSPSSSSSAAPTTPTPPSPAPTSSAASPTGPATPTSTPPAPSPPPSSTSPSTTLPSSPPPTAMPPSASSTTSPLPVLSSAPASASSSSPNAATRRSSRRSAPAATASGKTTAAPAPAPTTTYYKNPRRDSPTLKSSIDIQSEWTMLEQIPFSTFTKLSFAVSDPPEELLQCSSLEFYDRFAERITPKSERRLERFKTRNFFKVTTTDDPVIPRLASEDRATAFATNASLSTLMCAPRFVLSWDMVIQRVGNKLFFDQRDSSQLDLLPVNETAQEPLPEARKDINSAHSLAMEATFINQNFSQQVLV